MNPEPSRMGEWRIAPLSGTMLTFWQTQIGHKLEVPIGRISWVGRVRGNRVLCPTWLLFAFEDRRNRLYLATKN